MKTDKDSTRTSKTNRRNCAPAKNAHPLCTGIRDHETIVKVQGFVPSVRRNAVALVVREMFLAFVILVQRQSTSLIPNGVDGTKSEAAILVRSLMRARVERFTAIVTGITLATDAFCLS